MKGVDYLVDSGASAVPAISGNVVATSRVRMVAWGVLTLAGLIDAVWGRHTMNPDGVSYLDMGDAMVRGDWAMAINAQWSPLYPWLQGLALRLFRPSAYSEFAVVHFVNFLIFLFALGCFEFLLRATVAGPSPADDVANGSGVLPRWTVFSVGYSVFLWSAISLITVDRVSPDMLMAGFLYLAVGLLLQLWARPQSYLRFVLLGASLGFGYLAKAAVFPLAFLFFALAWVLAGGWRRATPRVLAAVVVFLAVTGPWFMALSQAKGRFTFGESSRVAYVAMVNDALPLWYFQDLGTANGHYLHTVRKIFDAPPIYEFATPIKGTYPVWYDPSYWSEGALPRVALKGQIALVKSSLRYYLGLLFTSQAALLVGFVILYFMAGRHYFRRQLATRWPVWLIGLTGLGMYAMVHVELRYIAVFLTLVWVGLFSGLAMPPGRKGQRLVPVIILVLVIATAIPVAVSTARHLREVVKGRSHNQWQVAEDLRAMGVMPGDRVARIGGRFGHVYWARLMRVVVVADVPGGHAKDFWNATPEVQAEAIKAFSRLGVTAIVAAPDSAGKLYVPGPEWQKVGDGTYFALRLAPDSPK